MSQASEGGGSKGGSVTISLYDGGECISWFVSCEDRCGTPQRAANGPDGGSMWDDTMTQVMTNMDNPMTRAVNVSFTFDRYHHDYGALLRTNRSWYLLSCPA